MVCTEILHVQEERLYSHCVISGYSSYDVSALIVCHRLHNLQNGDDLFAILENDPRLLDCFNMPDGHSGEARGIGGALVRMVESSEYRQRISGMYFGLRKTLEFE